MPFSEVSRMDQRLEFCRLADGPGANMAQLCARFGVSRQTGYVWLGRYREGGLAGMAERSRRPHGSPSQTGPQMEAAVLAVRAQHPAWGGRKIAAVLRAELGAAPSPSTVTAILRRNGVALNAGTGQRVYTRFEHDRPNALWQMDFKGHVALKTGARLHPLTVLDDHSRYALCVAACANERTETVKAHLMEIFRLYGLPDRIMTDNGPPWGNGPGDRFTPLGLFLIDQDIAITHARPYHPQTMGKDERFHRSLKAEALAGPAFDDLAAAQRGLDAFRESYNTRRPHEALGLRPPVTRYHASTRSYRETPAEPEYGPDDQLRRVDTCGHASLQGRKVRLPKAFRARAVAFRPTAADGVFDVFYRRQKIKTIDLRASSRRAQTVRDVPEHVSTMSPA